MGRGGRGGGARNPANQPRDVQVSRAVSKLLRHGAEQQGLKLGKGGYVNVQDALNTNLLKSVKVTFPELKQVVATNDKQRFSMILASQLTDTDTPADSSPAPSPALDLDPNADADSLHASDNPADYLIRANQGHSLAVDTQGLLLPITLSAANLPPMVVHGTDEAALALIFLGGGLRCMGRTHMHFAPGLPGPDTSAGPPVISGMRRTASVLIFVDMEAALAAGIEFFVSQNGVVLSAGDGAGVLPCRFFKRVERRRDGAVVMENGVLPQGVVVDVEAWKARVGDATKWRGGSGGRGGRGGGARGGSAREPGESREVLEGAQS